MARKGDEGHPLTLFFSLVGSNISMLFATFPWLGSALAHRQYTHASPVLRVFPAPLFLMLL